MNILFAVLFVVFPAFIVWLCYRFKAMQKIGIVLLCYLSGIIVGNLGILPDSFSGIQSTMQDVSVCLALPLLLFSIDIKKWFKVAKKGIVCMGLAVVSIAIVTFILQLTLGRSNELAPKLAGMAAGVYTGGTPNLAAISAALNVDSDTFILFNTYDMVISALYILFMCSFGRVFFQKVFKLKAFKHETTSGEDSLSGASDESIDDAYKGIFKPAILKGIILAILLSAVILAVAYFIGGLFPNGYTTAVTILIITTLGIAASFIKPLRNIKKSFPTGMYIIYVFCFTVASMADISKLVKIDFTIFAYVSISIFGSIFIHALLSKLAKIDSDTMIITSVSAICSPPFVPVVAGALKNKDILLPGITTGIIGYVIGNYLGISLAWLYEKLPF